MAVVLSRDGRRLSQTPPAPSFDGGRPLPLSEDVLAGFRVVYAVPSPEPLSDPHAPTRTISRMPDGRFVLVEMQGQAGSILAGPVSPSTLLDLSSKLLQGDLTGQIDARLDKTEMAVALVMAFLAPSSSGSAA